MAPRSKPPPGLPSRRISPERLYWLVQVGGWGGVAGLHISMLATVNRLTASMASGFVLASALAFLGSDGLRRILHRRGWIHLSLPRLGWRVAGGCIVIATVIVAGAVGMERILFGDGDLIPLAPGNLARLVAYWTTLLLCWSVGYLGLYFYRQARLAERDRWKLRAMVRETELEVLKSQLDPHFMFNSLNSIRALIAVDAARAREMVTQLAAILRYSLKASRATTVPLDEEMGVVRSYLALESIRLEERLRYRLEIDPEANCARIPPMMVQLLVENGIKHGISTRVEGGEIRVVAAARDGVLEILIHNSGHLAGVPAAGGVGLQNARERLRLIYGDDAGLILTESPAGVVVAALRLPLEVRDEGDHYR